VQHWLDLEVAMFIYLIGSTRVYVVDVTVVVGLFLNFMRKSWLVQGDCENSYDHRVLVLPLDIHSRMQDRAIEYFLAVGCTKIQGTIVAVMGEVGSKYRQVRDFRSIHKTA
jgi:hypothetical protein